MSETKLRDVLLGALHDIPQIESHEDDERLVDMVMRRLQHAPNIELDDGTVFIRRSLVPRQYCCTHRRNETPAGMAARCECVCHR